MSTVEDEAMDDVATRILQALGKHCDFSMTMLEIAEALGVSFGDTLVQVRKLERDHLVTCHVNNWRASGEAANYRLTMRSWILKVLEDGRAWSTREISIALHANIQRMIDAELSSMICRGEVAGYKDLYHRPDRIKRTRSIFKEWSDDILVEFNDNLL